MHNKYRYSNVIQNFKGIVSMVNYEIQKHNVNPEKIYVTGLSSGAMMTNVLLAEYPDVFRAGLLVGTNQ